MLVKFPKSIKIFHNIGLSGWIVEGEGVMMGPGVRDDKDFSACGIFGIMDRSGTRFRGRKIVRAMENMKVRGNGLGAGYAVYGLYKQYKQYYALHMIFDEKEAKRRVDEFLQRNFEVVHEEAIPTDDSVGLPNPPLFWRYFVSPKKKGVEKSLGDEDYVISKVMHINTSLPGAYVISSGRNMGIFKGVGFPEEIAEFFMLEEYKGYMWTAHTRFPTNTPGWWGGAHPFGILDWSVVHNGEISSYGTNKRYLEMFGYYSTLKTDTEVLAYIFDLLMRKQGLPIETVAKILAPPTWDEIDAMEEKERAFHTALRMTYAPLLVNGPWAVVVAKQGLMFGLTDRIRLRPLTTAERGEFFFISSEEAAIRAVSPNLDRVYTPYGGEPVVAALEEKALKKVLGE